MFTRLHDPEWEDAYRKTHEGQAHLAGSGPDKTCRDCRFFGYEGRYAANSAKHVPHSLKPGHCGKYTILMKRKGKKIPHDALSCRHFEQRERPLAAVWKPGLPSE